jgi:hypothetical protein
MLDGCHDALESVHCEPLESECLIVNWHNNILAIYSPSSEPIADECKQTIARDQYYQRDINHDRE